MMARNKYHPSSMASGTMTSSKKFGLKDHPADKVGKITGKFMWAFWITLPIIYIYHCGQVWAALSSMVDIQVAYLDHHGIVRVQGSLKDAQPPDLDNKCPELPKGIDISKRLELLHITKTGGSFLEILAAKVSTKHDLILLHEITITTSLLEWLPPA